LRRHRTISRKSAKPQHGSTTKPKRNNALPAARPASSTLADLQEQVSALSRELTQALEQQAATVEVLRVISSSPGELDLVFKAMLKNATRVCGAKFGVLFRYEGGLFHPMAMIDVPPAFADFLIRQGAFPPLPGRQFGRLCQTKNVVHVADVASEPGPPPSLRYGGARSTIAVPLLNKDELVGAFFIYRTEVQPFTDKEIEFVKNFANQAVIAIENTRLPRHRHREHAPAQRAAGIAAAADCHRRRAQGDQPLDLRSADRARYARRVRGAAVRRI
jgi:GAF domain-containing protein